jgi:hypothetical protein
MIDGSKAVSTNNKFVGKLGRSILLLHPTSTTGGGRYIKRVSDKVQGVDRSAFGVAKMRRVCCLDASNRHNPIKVPLREVRLSD